jgi:hypothetical protein
MKIKDYYNGDCAKLLADKIEVIFPDFKGVQFINYVEENVPDKEFSKRMDVFSDAFELYLPNDFKQNIKLFENILGDELKQETGMFSEGWWLWPVGRYVERHGIENVTVSLNFIKELTKRQMK